MLGLSLPLFAPQPGQRRFPWADRGAPGWRGDWCSGDSAPPAAVLTRLHNFISNDVFISLISFLWLPAILILVISRQGQRCKCQSCGRRITCVCWRLIAGILGVGGQAALIIGAYHQNYATTLQALWLARQQKDLEGERAGWCMLLDGWAGQQPVQLHTTPHPWPSFSFLSAAEVHYGRKSVAHAGGVLLFDWHQLNRHSLASVCVCVLYIYIYACMYVYVCVFSFCWLLFIKIKKTVMYLVIFPMIIGRL